MNPVAFDALVDEVHTPHGLVVVKDHGRAGEVHIALCRAGKPAAGAWNEKFFFRAVYFTDRNKI